MPDLWKKIAPMCVLAVLVFAGLLGSQPQCSDKDWDGVPDSKDNCPDIFNPLQEDENGNGIGDACDDISPMHQYKFGQCYATNWDHLTGPGWEDIKTMFTHPDQRHFSAQLTWPDIDRPTIEIGPGSQNGKGIWFMTQYLGVNFASATYVEGHMVIANPSNLVTHMEGSYIMLVDNNYNGISPQWSQFSTGIETWKGDLMPNSYCGLPNPDDDDDNDSAPDDDASPDDDISPDDDATDDDNDAADDDSADDDASPTQSDNSNSKGGCGC